MIRIYRAGTAAEAHLLVSELQQQGIATHLENTEVQVMLGNIESSQPEVWLVQDGDEARATIIVKEFEARRRSAAGSLVCPVCKEENPANFELCWKCRSPISAPGCPAPGPLAAAEPWDLVSAGYAEESAAVMLPFTRDAIGLSNLGATSEVLDVATGPGVLALELAPRVKRIDAVDFSPAMLEQLEQKRRALGIQNVFAQQADGQALPFADQSFDAAFSMFGLMFFPDRNRGFAELYRTLRPGGVAVVSSWAPVDQSPLMIVMFGALRAADPTRAAPQTNLLSLENPELFRRELTQAGFRDVRVEPYTHGVQVDDPDRFWGVMERASAPLVLLRRKLGPAEWERQSKLARAHVAEQVPTPRLLTTTAYLGFGRR